MRRKKEEEEDRPLELNKKKFEPHGEGREEGKERTMTKTKIISLPPFFLTLLPLLPVFFSPRPS